MIAQEAGEVVERMDGMAQNLPRGKIDSPLDVATSRNTSRSNNVPTFNTTSSDPMRSFREQNERTIRANKTNLMEFSARTSAKSGG